jgi:hypothetical protein
MTFEEALAQIEAAVREHGAARRLRTLLRVSEAVPSRKSGSLWKWSRSARPSKGSWAN